MRRLRIVLAGLVAMATAGAWSGGASADPLAGGGFCGTVEDAVAELDDAVSLKDIDFTDPEATKKLYRQAADIYKDLAKNAPKKLRSSFKTVSKFLRALSEIDLTDPEEAGNFPTQTRKMARAFEKVTNYFVDECDIDLSAFEGLGGQ
ncbi:MAG TPA: hypothetical protein VMQ81_07065 [Acidimicrobiia bacterium]|nr:hypothetical protein [Acidimicrobiia bacterium]